MNQEEWIPISSAVKPLHGEYVLVLTTDADGDPLVVTAHYNGGDLYLGIGGKKVKPTLYWMQTPKLPKGLKS